MLRDGNERRRYVPAVLLILLVLRETLTRLQLWPVSASVTGDGGYYARLMLLQLLMWLLPALCFLPWRHQRLGPKHDVAPLTVLAPAAGALLQLFLL